MEFIRQKQSYCSLAIFVALFTLCGGALALGRGKDPNISPVVLPGTQTQTPVWKLAGTVLGASGVQIAPQWILSAKHVIPSQPASGSVFKNASGSAILGQCYWPAATLYSSGVAPDMALCKLNAAIAAPGGIAFPKLVQNPSALANGAPLNIISPRIGMFLAVGFGNPTSGQARYAWVDALGMPYPDYSAGSLGWNAPLPYRDHGDSGSPTFWFGNGTPALVGVTANGGPIRLDTGFDQTTLKWLSDTVSANSSNSISTALASEYFGVANQAPPWLDNLVISIPQSTSTSVTLTWKKPSAYDSLVSTYLITIEKGSELSRSLFVSANNALGLQTTTLNGLETNVDYLMCIIPAGQGTSALGEAIRFAPYGNSNVGADFSKNCINQVKLSPAADAVQNLVMRTSVQSTPGVGTYPTYAATWSAPTTPANISIVGYRITEKIDGEAERVSDKMGTSTVLGGGFRVSGQRICVTVTPITAPVTFGTKSPPVCATMP